MRKTITLLSTMMLISLLAACSGQGTSTAVPETALPTLTTEEPTLETPMMTETPVATQEVTPVGGIPVTGEEDPSRLSNELGYDVLNGNGDQIGEVNDMVIDLDKSRVSYVIVGTGGFLDIGEKNVLVPWDQLELQSAADNSTSDQNAFILLADQQKFENAPDVDVNSLLPAQGEPANGWDADISNYWQSAVIPGTPEATGNATPETTGLATSTPEAMSAGTAMPSMDGTTSGALQGVVLASDLIGSNLTVGANGEMLNGQSDTVGTATPEAMGTMAVGTGTPVVAMNDQTQETTATVDDVIVDTTSGEIQYLVLNAAFSDGERLIPVPLNQFGWDATNGSYILNTDQATLAGAPSFPNSQYPDTSTQGWDAQYLDYWQ